MPPTTLNSEEPFFVSFPTPADDANCSKEFPVAERSAAQRPTPDF